MAFMASLSTATIFAARTPHKAAVVLSTTDSQNDSVSFAANTDGAEKGISGSLIKLDNMKRATTSKENAPQLPTLGPDSGQETEQASSTGASRYAGLQTPLDSSIQSGTDENDINDPPELIHPTTSSSTTYSSTGTPENDSTSIKKQIDEDETTTRRAALISRFLSTFSRVFSLLGSKPRIAENTGHERILNKHYKDYPPGFPQLAAFFNSSDNVAIARRFGRAHFRVLLHLTCEIDAIEKELDELDEADSKGPTKYRLRRSDYHGGWDPAQKDLIEKLRRKLVEYDDLLLKDTSLRALAPAPVRDHLSVFNWIYAEKPLDKGQYDFIYHQDDFVSLANKPPEGFDNFIISCLSRSPGSRIQQFFRHGDESQQAQDRHAYLFSPEKTSLAAQIIAISIVVTILLVPIFLLLLTEMSRKATSVMVLLLTLSFAALISFTGGKAESVFIGTCTYCAVLVTFLGNLQGATATTLSA